jgi:hypothetical protein
MIIVQEDCTQHANNRGRTQTIEYNSRSLKTIPTFIRTSLDKGKDIPVTGHGGP